MAALGAARSASEQRDYARPISLLGGGRLARRRQTSAKYSHKIKNLMITINSPATSLKPARRPSVAALRSIIYARSVGLIRAERRLEIVYSRLPSAPIAVGRMWRAGHANGRPSARFACAPAPWTSSRDHGAQVAPAREQAASGVWLDAHTHTHTHTNWRALYN